MMEKDTSRYTQHPEEWQLIILFEGRLVVEILETIKKHIPACYYGGGGWTTSSFLPTEVLLRLWILFRTVKIVVDMVNEGLVNLHNFIKMVQPQNLDQLHHP